MKPAQCKACWNGTADWYLYWKTVTCKNGKDRRVSDVLCRDCYELQFLRDVREDYRTQSKARSSE